MKPKLISGEDKETLDTKLREKEEDIKNLAVVCTCIYTFLNLPSLK